MVTSSCRKGRKKIRAAAQTGEVSFNPTMPATISVRHRMRTGSAGSLYRIIPTMMEPVAPIPVHTAYAVPNGSERNARAINPKLSAIATSVATAGQKRVRPLEYFSPSAHPISSRPAPRSAIHALTVFSVPASVRRSSRLKADASLRGSRDRDVTGEPPVSSHFRPGCRKCVALRHDSCGACRGTSESAIATAPTRRLPLECGRYRPCLPSHFRWNVPRPCRFACWRCGVGL